MRWNHPILDNLNRLRWNLALLILCAVGGAFAVVTSLHFRKEAQDAERIAQSARDDARGRLSRARDEEQDLRSKIERFRTLSNRGLIGQERRLDWVEQIRRIKEARKLIDVQYELRPQQPLDPALVPAGDAPFEFMESQMHLQMQLLDEDDLLNFLADLRSTVTAFIRVKSCSVERVAADNPAASGIAQLRADCTLDWITLREKPRATP